MLADENYGPSVVFTVSHLYLIDTFNSRRFDLSEQHICNGSVSFRCVSKTPKGFSTAFLVGVGSTKPKTSVRDYEDHKCCCFFLC